MTKLQERSLGRVPLAIDDVEKYYLGQKQGNLHGHIATLCESHERLRTELQGAEILINDTEQEIASVLLLMDGLAEQWGDEGVFRRCRDRLRKLASGVKRCPKCGWPLAKTMEEGCVEGNCSQRDR